MCTLCEPCGHTAVGVTTSDSEVIIVINCSNIISNMHSMSRRRVLGAIGAGVGMSALAGCTGGDADGGRFAEASFHVMGDLTGAIVGDVDTTATLVPIGQHGHGWEAGPAEIGRASCRERVFRAV